MQTIFLYGEEIPQYVNCNRCVRKDCCEFIDGVGYYQPCNECRKTIEYREELDRLDKEKKRLTKVNESLENVLPVAVHEYAGQYLYTNKRGDIIKSEKIRPMKRGEKYKK